MNHIKSAHIRWLCWSWSVKVYDGDKWWPVLCIKDRTFRWFQIAILSSVRGSEPSTNKRRRLHICDISLINGRMHLKKDRSSFFLPCSLRNSQKFSSKRAMVRKKWGNLLHRQYRPTLTYSLSVRHALCGRPGRWRWSSSVWGHYSL